MNYMQNTERIDLKMSKKRILVTGICGMIGSHTAGRLLQLGYEVYGVDDLSTGNYENIEKIRGNIEFYNFDINNSGMINYFTQNKIDIICHQAALCNVPKSMKDPNGYFENNVLGTHRLLMYAYNYGIKKVILASSSAATEYLSPYGVSKRVIEQYSAFYNNIYDMNIVNLRYFNVYGPRQSMDNEYSMVIPIFINKLLKSEQPTIYGNGEQSRDFIFVDDVVDANIAAIENDYRGIASVGIGKDVTINKLFEFIAKLLGKEYIKPIYTTKRPGDALHTKADIRPGVGFHKHWTPKTNIYTGLKKTIDWWRENE